MLSDYPKSKVARLIKNKEIVKVPYSNVCSVVSFFRPMEIGES